MVTCDVCNASTTWEQGTAYTADEFRTIVCMGFEPPAHLIMLLPNGLQGWKYGLVANSTTGWLLCPSCARRAMPYMRKPVGTGPAGHVLHETMAESKMLGLDPESLINMLVGSTPPPPIRSEPVEESKPALPEEETTWDKTKTCPHCEEEIESGAVACPNCGAKFSVTFKGYCPTEHAIVETNDQGLCSQCGKEVLDLRVESRMTEAPPPVLEEIEPEAKLLEVQPTEKPEPAASVPAADSAPTKKCPRCAEEIKAEARICRYCKAKFIVSVKGYCPRDRQLVEANADGRCSTCQGELIDIHVDSKLVEEVDITPAGVMQIPNRHVVPVPQPMPSSSAQLKRPGCLTAYAILLWIGGGLMVLGALAIPSSMPSNAGGGAVTIMLLGMATLTIAVGVGLWQLKNWARITVIVLISLSLISNLITGIVALVNPTEMGISGGQTPGALCGYVISFAISIWMLNWFTQNKQYFVQQISMIQQTGVVSQPAPTIGIMDSPEFSAAMATARNRKDQPKLDHLVQQRIRCEKCKSEVTFAEAFHVRGTKIGENMYETTSNPSLICPNCGTCWIQF